MKKFLPALLLVAMTGTVACKDKNKEQEKEATTEQSTQTPENKPAEQPVNTNAPLEYTVKATPDTILAGKDKKLLIQILEAKGLVQQDPDGKVLGTELTIKLRGTNKHFVGDSDAPSYSIYQPDQRLELDNGTSIGSKQQPELAPEKETSKEVEMIFELPAGTKPTKLNLYEYYSKTRYTLTLAVEEKK